MPTVIIIIIIVRCQIDLLLVTHFHLDHAASLPYLTEKTGFKGRVFCTHPTKAVMRMLLADYIRLVNVHTEDILYDEKVACFVRAFVVCLHPVRQKRVPSHILSRT